MQCRCLPHTKLCSALSLCGSAGKAAAPKPRNTRKPPLAPSGRSTAQQLAPGTCSNTPAAPIGPVTTSAAETEGGCGTATNSGSDAGADSTAAPAAAGGGVVDTGMSDACGGEVLAASGRRKRKDSGQKRERGKVKDAGPLLAVVLGLAWGDIALYSRGISLHQQCS